MNIQIPDIRPAKQVDISLLWDFLAIAAYESGGPAAQRQPEVAAHLQDWPRGDDFGFIAWMDAAPVGAAWVKQFGKHEQPSVYFDDRTPELSIGVSEKVRRAGIGSQLLDAILSEACRRELNLCLTVRHTNPAVHLYLSRSFVRLPHLDVPNRVGGISHVMLWRCVKTAAASQ